jgi:hypothetical protein
MADKKPYDSIIDAFLADREPDWKGIGMDDAKKSGDDWMDRAHAEVDTDFEDEIAESASRHTPVWGPKSGKKQTPSEEYQARMAAKDMAPPRIAAVKDQWHKEAYPRQEDFKSDVGDNDSLLDELTMSVDKAYSGSNLAENSAAKKEITDGQIQTYIRKLLNSGTSPAKVAAKLVKLAEIELFNHQSATDYLQRNAGLMGLAYLEPNTYMDKTSPKYERTASGSADCVAQKQAFDKEGIKVKAHSVKQVKACSGCAYFKKDATGKTCNLYHLPVVANTGELTQIVNHLTPGVPEKKKHAALVVLANGDEKRVAPVKFGDQTNLIKTADAKVKNQTKRASSLFSDERETKQHFSSEHVGKMHDRGASLQQIYKWATEKFGDVDTSLAFRGFVQNLKKDAKGKIVVASADLKFLNGIGIRSEAYVGAAKCASCPTHFTRQAREVEEDRGAQRVDQKFAAHTIDVARNMQKEAATVTIQRDAVRKLHSAGHSLERIFEGVARKVGSVQARKLMADFVIDVKKRPGKTAVNEKDRAFLIGKLGFKPEAVRLLDPNRRPTNQVVAAVPDGTRIMAYPGMDKQAGERVATDGHAILNEYDLSNPVEGPTIDTDGPQRGEVEMNPTMTAGDLE